MKKELEFSIQQNQQEEKFIPMVESSGPEGVIPSEETCFNNLEAIVESIAQQNASVGYAITETVPGNDLDYDDFVGIETVDDNRDAVRFQIFKYSFTYQAPFSQFQRFNFSKLSRSLQSTSLQ